MAKSEEDEGEPNLEPPQTFELIRRINWHARAHADLGYEAESMVLCNSKSQKHIHIEAENDVLIVRPCDDKSCDRSARDKHVMKDYTVLSTPCDR